jgi:hypothetical protein
VHRLFITALDTLGIRAAQVTVYRREDPAAAHCLAQVRTESANMLIDVDYGVCLQHPDGGPIDLAGLRSGVRPAIHPFIRQQASYADDEAGASLDIPIAITIATTISAAPPIGPTPYSSAVYAALLTITRGRVAVCCCRYSRVTVPRRSVVLGVNPPVGSTALTR